MYACELHDIQKGKGFSSQMSPRVTLTYFGDIEQIEILEFQTLGETTLLFVSHMFVAKPCQHYVYVCVLIIFDDTASIYLNYMCIEIFTFVPKSKCNMEIFTSSKLVMI